MDKFVLMNREEELMELKFDAGDIVEIIHINNQNMHLLPEFLKKPIKNGISRKEVATWWVGRQIPASRSGIKDLFWGLPPNTSIAELVEKSLGLSLSDQYWIRPSNMFIKWKDVNFFDNSFSEDIGNLLVTGGGFNGNLVSPDNTSDGNLKKRWKIIDGTRYLLKGSSNIVFQAEPFREVLAYNMTKALLEPFEAIEYAVPYHIILSEGKKGNEFYSACPNFLDSQSEYVAFNQINNSHKIDNRTSPYEFYKKFYGNKGYLMDIMFLLDYIILNEDRHFGNFGLIRNAITGLYTSPAPIFDTGSSLFYDSILMNVKDCEAKPLNKNFEKQISKINLKNYTTSLTNLKQKLDDIFDYSFKNSPESQERLERMRNSLRSRTNRLLR